MKRFLQSTLILTFSNITVRIAGHFYRILMGRLLLPHEFGILNLALPVQYMAIVLTSSGIAPSIAKFVSEYKAGDEQDKLDSTISSSLFYYAIIGVLIGAFFILIAGPLGIKVFHTPEAVLPLRISAIAIPFGIIIAVYTGIFQGFKRMGYMAFTLIFEQALRVAIATILVFYGLSAIGAISGSSLGFVFTVPVAYMLFKYMKLGYCKQSFEVFKAIFSFSIPTSVTALSAFILAYIDVIFIGFYLTPYEVGIYSAASPTSRLVLAFTAALYAVLLPSISELGVKGNRAKMRSYAKDSLLVTVFVLVPVILFSIYFSENIIVLLFGTEYTGAVKSFEILVIGSGFLGVFTVCSSIFQGLGKPEIPMKLLLGAATLDIILNISLIPEYQIAGAAFAAASSGAFAAMSSLIMLRRLL